MLPLQILHQLICKEDNFRVLDGDWRNSTLNELPHATECAQHIDFSLIPFAFLLIFSPVVFYDLKKSENPPARPCSPIAIRVFLCFVLILCHAMSFIIHVFGYRNQSGYKPALFAYGDFGQTLASLLAFVLTMACRNRGVGASGPMFCFWLLCVLFGFPEMRVAVNQVLGDLPMPRPANTVLYIVAYVIWSLNLLLSCFADDYRRRKQTKSACPELNTSFLNQITFQWFTSLAILGNRKPLERDDLWDLNERDRSRTLVPEFDKNFLPGVKEYLSERAANPTKEFTEKDHPSILWPIIKTHKFSIISGAFFKLIFDLLQFVAPALLNMLISFIQDKKQPLYVGIFISSLLFLTAAFQSMILHQYFHSMFRLGMNIRTALTAAVYRKALSLSNAARKNRTTGEIVNLMSIDIQRFQDMSTFAMLFWSAPLQVSLSVYFLWRLLGIAVLAGLLILILLLPFNAYISVLMRKRQVEQMKFKDERLKLMSEILNGMKVLKLYAWEKSMRKQVLEIRKKEITVLKKIAYLSAFMSLSWACAPFIVAVLTFGVYVKLDPQNNVLTPQVTFVALALFNILRFPLAIFAMIFSQAVQCAVSNKRLKGFFAEEEMDDTSIERDVKEGECVNIENASFAWDNAYNATLRDINLTIKRGELVAVVGRVGSGKSSLLSAMLGEMTKKSGRLCINGDIAFVPQQPWIQNLSLRDNILFNKPMDLDKYYSVIDACALRPDLASLPAEDLTEIGEKGINLSGGQKQRVSLARAVYSANDVVFLDDPLSAVDAHVGKHIFEKVISSTTGVLKDTTRVFVTHGIHFLKYCDRVVVLKDGEVSECGTYKELLARQGPFSEFIEEFLLEEASKRGRSVSFGEDEEEVEEILSAIEKVDPTKKVKLQKQLSQVKEKEEKAAEIAKTQSARTSSTHERGASVRKSGSLGAQSPDQPSKDEESQPNYANGTESIPLIENGEKKKPATPKGKIIEKEGMETGKVKWSVYLLYIKAIGIAIVVVFCLVYVFSSALGVYSNLWLADWSDNAQAIQSLPNGGSETNRRLLIYTLLGLGQAFTVCLASVLMALGMVRASRKLHEGILSTTLRAPMSFLDVTPIGRIINRFGKDIDTIDSALPNSVRSLLVTGIAAVATIVVVIWSTPMTAIPLLFLLVLYMAVLDIDDVDSNVPRSFSMFLRTVLGSLEILSVIVWATPTSVVGLVPLLLVYFLVLRFYVSTSRQLKRLDSTTRSPIFSHFQESIQGASSIRAYHVTDKFVEESSRRVDNNIATYYPSIVANRWLAVRLELVGNLIVLFAALFAVLFRDSPGLTAGLVGLSVSYALNITQTLNWAVRMTSELETNIVAVERIDEYAQQEVEGLPNEREPKNSSWPSEGAIDFKDYKMRYRKGLDLVLKGVSAHIEPGKKVGIVGRTGAGKSSLTLALFRIVEADGGEIVIDGERIDQISLETLRSRLTIVPQDPVLFSGTLRHNLDPFGRYSDDAVWEAIRESHLELFVKSLGDGLDHKVAEGGENLSVGQRQLLCLARALLRKTKVLILDEAAAAVDMETDSLIQKAIREQFKGCTVLTIAHRLNTIMDYDILLVMDDGRISEMDSPSALLSKPNGLFRSMAVDAGIISS